ncbi:PRD domain-containing protein [Pseudolactococcus yaeyamensis]
MNEGLIALYQELELSEEVQSVIQKIENSLNMLTIRPNDLQWRILVNHVNEMVNRSKEGGTIPEVDAQLFSEISKTSLKLAEEIVSEIGHLSPDEKYLLSIHFESAKLN